MAETPSSLMPSEVASIIQVPMRDMRRLGAVR
jgi:hypothetical protein